LNEREVVREANRALAVVVAVVLTLCGVAVIAHAWTGSGPAARASAIDPGAPADTQPVSSIDASRRARSESSAAGDATPSPTTTTSSPASKGVDARRTHCANLVAFFEPLPIPGLPIGPGDPTDPTTVPSTTTPPTTVPPTTVPPTTAPAADPPVRDTPTTAPSRTEPPGAPPVPPSPAPPSPNPAKTVNPARPVPTAPSPSRGANTGRPAPNAPASSPATRAACA
jgi:carboxypeptidase N regulatory subunit